VNFRTRTFFGIFVATALALAVSSGLVSVELRRSMDRDISGGNMREARLASALLAGRHQLADPDGEADGLGKLIGARVTFIAADGRVLGDSEVARDALPGLENHASRPEVVEALRSGEGASRRKSATTGVDTEYSAVAVRDSDVAVVRVALPLTSVEQRIAAVRRWALVGLGVGLAMALVVTWVASRLLSRRMADMAQTARRYRQGDFSQPVRDYGRDEIGIVAGVLDHTARELGGRLNDMAREREHMEAILTGMVEGVVLINGNGRLVLTNPALREMLRLPDGSEGRHYLEVVRQPDIAAQLASALKGATPPAAEVQLEKDVRRTFIAHVVPVAPERSGGAVLVLHDVTDLRRLDQVRRDFVANVSHELRTPLTAIRGYVEALLDSQAAPGDARRFLEIVARHTFRMEQLVRDLLRLARLDAGQEAIERATCSVGDLVSGVEHDLQALLASRTQHVAVSIPSDAETIRGDVGKLHDVLRNLIENASHYSPEGGTIEFSSQRDAEGISLTVADRGSGIAESDLPRIFERFYRADRSRTRDPGGTGLGLSIVKHLVELHGGRVTAANRPGGGATFTVTIGA
jgi:two-component system, OmpR family, phosphate regulon sensor histidine kinase PhoR